MPKLPLLLIFIFLFYHGFAKPNSDSTLIGRYDSAYLNLQNMLIQNGSFKDAVFTVENTYFQNALDKSKFDNPIHLLKGLCIEWAKVNKLKEYKFSDSIGFQKNFSIFKILTDTTKIIDTKSIVYLHVPFRYDFYDFSGKISWSNMFVSKLLITKKGNCHSLPYLYKILADELGATCWLSFAPNHIYIKNRCQQAGWYNTELTSGQFPIDAWIATSSYVPIDAIRNGIYMDTLSNQQSIAICVLDLAKAYEFQTKNYTDSFILKCCNLTLKYHSLNTQAMLLKAETLKRIYEKEKKKNDTNAKATYKEMEQLFVRLFELGYREMPDKMYMQWLQSVVKQRNKYGNNKIKDALSKH